MGLFQTLHVYIYVYIRIRKFRYDRKKKLSRPVHHDVTHLVPFSYPQRLENSGTGPEEERVLARNGWEKYKVAYREVSRGDNIPGKIDSESDGYARMPFQYVCMHGEYIYQLSGKVGELTEKRLTKRRIRRRNSRRTVGQWNCSAEDRIRIVGKYILGYILWGETSRHRGRGRRR